jgi:hypothetical protein
VLAPIARPVPVVSGARRAARVHTARRAGARRAPESGTARRAVGPSVAAESRAARGFAERPSCRASPGEDVVPPNARCAAESCAGRVLARLSGPSPGLGSLTMRCSRPPCPGDFPRWRAKTVFPVVVCWSRRSAAELPRWAALESFPRVERPRSIRPSYHHRVPRIMPTSRTMHDRHEAAILSE